MSRGREAHESGLFVRTKTERRGPRVLAVLVRCALRTFDKLECQGTAAFVPRPGVVMAESDAERNVQQADCTNEEGR